ncbi:MAG: efflux RND transporter periplasmic adaptor subunit [Bryobacterales bacterium]|nr:efflux RND transporter periplasmic adaptor subunit [Bryobacterales bacterium]MBV9398963.1 efflux RND transporter periplasmic adaptor subunit [Bryobacterales bacterium]
MDIKREGVARRKRIRLAIYLIIVLAVLGVVGWRIYKLPQAAPSVERATVWVDTVKRGPMLRDVKGIGTLIPEDIVWIPANSEGQVSKVLVNSGAKVKPETILVVLSNPDMELAANDFEWQVKQAEADLADTRVRLESQRLDQQSLVATVASDMRQAEITKDKDQQLLKMQLKSEIDAKLSTSKWEQLKQKYEIEQKRLEIMSESISAQMDAKQVQIDKLRAAQQLKKQQVGELSVRAGIEGVVQEITLQPGQRVRTGDVLAKVAQPWKLKAEIKIAETQAKDVQLGQVAQIDTRNGIIPGHVIRIDPNVVNGTRTVDCKLEGPLPPGAVPDLSVDGTVEIERLPDVVYVGRPVFGQPNSQVSLFKLEEDGKGASRVPVKLGRSSVNSIEVVDGLKVGDQVILSDMSSQDQSSRIRLN